MADTQDRKTGKPGGWTRVLLFASLAGNLLVVGLIAGALLRHDRMDIPNQAHRPPGMQDMGFGPYGQALSAQDRVAITEEYRAQGPALQANREKVRRQIKSLLRALRARPFDPAKVQELATQQQELLFERHGLGQRILLDRITAMDDVQRAAFAKRLENSLRRGPRDKPNDP